MPEKIKRPELLEGRTHKIVLECGNFYITINKKDDKIIETFMQLGKAGGCAYSQLEALSRIISLALRCDVDCEKIIKQLEGIRCPLRSISKGCEYFSCADAIAKVLKIESQVDKD